MALTVNLRMWAIATVCTSLLTMTSAAAQDRLWFYAPVNFQVDKDVDRLLTLLDRAAAAGYNGVVVTDYKFGKLVDRPENYYRNLQRFREAAERLRVEPIPLLMQLGYSNSLLQNDPNLAAALPARQMRFQVHGTVASIEHAENLLPGGTFDDAGKQAPSGWDWSDRFGSATTLDRTTRHRGASSLRLELSAPGPNGENNYRVVKRLAVQPFHQYRLTAWIKAEDMAADEFRFAALAGEQNTSLNYASLGVKPTQDWTSHAVVFNSLDHHDVGIYLGAWGGRSGRVWIDDVVLEEVGGINLLRRSGCPIRVVSDDLSTEFEEERDFVRWHDPSLGNVPYAGEFEDQHHAPPLRLTANSRIRDGQHLRVSFFHAVRIHDGQVCSCLINEALFPLLQIEVEKLNDYLRPRRFFMSHDEIRVAGWDDEEQGKSPGELLAANVKRCEQMIHQLRPDAEVLVWSDMFDPHHNAHDQYYLVRGNLAGSWQGLPARVSLVNWNSDAARDSLNFFANRGHHQVIAGYYDGDVQQNVARWQTASHGIQAVDGYLYTTWTGNYDALESFAMAVKRRP